jgi:hypothetical protein
VILKVHKLQPLPLQTGRLSTKRSGDCQVPALPPCQSLSPAMQEGSQTSPARPPPPSSLLHGPKS